MPETFPRRADFNHQPLVGFFRPEADQGVVTRSYFGLVLEGTWFYGILRTEDGRSYALLRKAVGYTTRDIAIMASDDIGLRADRRSAQACIGGKVRRDFVDGYDLTAGGSARGANFEVRLGDSDCTWQEQGTEGPLLDIHGGLAAPGFHVYVPWRNGPGEAGTIGEPGALYYTSTPYFAEGTMFGEPVTGFFAVDQSYLPHGVDWNNSAIWMRLQGGWNVFANEYADGSVEWGHMSIGADRFRFAAVASSDAILVDSRSVDAEIDWRDDEFVDRITFDVGDGQPWEFVTDPNGQMVEFSAARPGWSGHAGLLRRVGETRTLNRHWAWQEVFPSRV
ncbi:hypothetical protein A4G26_11165 [Mycobacterium kansasii]|uniref:AttH domain-containing protein n=1 Tax=Mycobacterium innocens TaxID=2341083 RepID=A0A498QL03_9MYCO|nr:MULTISPECIES: hypothetical protein [Mycobacterium]KZS61295.1 hypothetical protein A4G26_11165 [Mycobacterium kansasii]VBA46316.1 hypothetical protein LAUMK13_05648 [Mycobacterium innocens]